MKEILITLKKGDAVAICRHFYHFTESPLKTVWKGDRTPFSKNGDLLDFWDGIGNLPRTVAHQAALCGAEFTIEDLGGEAQVWMDEVEGFEHLFEDEPDSN